ncbi:MAG: PRC-barrel domain-containing protein [Rhodothermales bacterium]|nr:PRC-barrel domain-containing protein [Rhodothermales bacterium]
MNTRTPNLLSSTSLTGTDVRNPQGEDLGEIKDLMIDLDDGHIAYAVLSFGGFLGIGDKYFALPWDMLTVDTKNECFVVNITKEQLDDAPGFDKDHWPQHEDTTFLDRVYTHYGYEPYSQRRTRVSEPAGML